VRQHTDGAHHPAILVLEKMAVLRKCADRILIAEVHPKFDAWINGAFPVPVRDIDRIAKERFVYRYTIPGKHQKVELMDVKGMQLAGPVFDDPVFYITLMGNDIRCRIISLSRLTIHSDHKNGWNVR
jgi:hypothetical protein